MSKQGAMDFTVDQNSKHCAFVADSGFVAPLIYSDQTRNLRLRPFLDSDANMQKQLCEHFASEWHEQTGAKTADEASRYIIKQWSSSDLMYVLEIDKMFCGCVAIDRNNFEPCVSHLTVVQSYRGQGLSKVLMEIAEAYIRDCLRFANVCLWCNTDMVMYYSKQGYKWIKDVDDGIVMMRKMLQDTTSTDKVLLDAFEPSYSEI